MPSNLRYWSLNSDLDFLKDGKDLSCTKTDVQLCDTNIKRNKLGVQVHKLRQVGALTCK